MATTFRPDIHFFPLYLKFAADRFRNGDTQEGQRFFKLACAAPRDLVHLVYKSLWEVKGRPVGDDQFGEKAFHGLEGLSSSASTIQKIQAIEMALRGVDPNELQMYENKIHEWLWAHNGQPLWDLEYGKHAFYGLHGCSSSLKEKISASTLTALKSREFTWFFENKEVRAIRCGNTLKYVAIDNISGRVKIDTIPLGELTVENAIPMLPSLHVTLNDEGVPVFPQAASFQQWLDAVPAGTLPAGTLPAGTLPVGGTRELKLLIKDNRFVWSLYDRVAKISSWVHAGVDAAGLVGGLMQIPATERESYRKDFHFATSFDAVTGRIDNVSVTKIGVQSQLDHLQIIDRDNWAITLISEGTSGLLGRTFDPFFGHAAIICERLVVGKMVTEKFHLGEDPENGFPTVIARAIPVEVGYRRKTPTWLLPRASVQQMICHINQQVGKPVAFNHTGNDWLSINTYKNFVTSFMQGCELGAQVRSLDDIWRLVRDNAQELQANQDYNCLTWTIETIGFAGLELPPFDGHIAVPDDYVCKISSNPNLVRRLSN